MTQNLYITYSNQKVRELKQNSNIAPFSKVITLDGFIDELFQKNSFDVLLDDRVATSIIYKIITDAKIEYFSYLSSDAASLYTIYSFIVKCHRNNISFETILSGSKLEAIEKIDYFYQEFKKNHHLVDTSDVETIALSYLSDDCFKEFDKVIVDEFQVGGINYIKSHLQNEIIKQLSHFQVAQNDFASSNPPKLITPSNEVFDTIDEVKTAIKIARKLLLQNEKAEDIIIVASDIGEYAPLYKLFLDEYKIKGYSSLGTPLGGYYDSTNPKVQSALLLYAKEILKIEKLYRKLGLKLEEHHKESIKESFTIMDEKVGIEITEPNQLVGIAKRYKHIIFIGTDINHFPPKSSDNFLYSYEDELNYFYANNYFTSSQTQYEELKRLSDNLYIITASHSGKRELSKSIIVDGKFDEVIDISDIKSINDLALEKTTILGENEPYFKSITNDEFTQFDGMDVENIKATHLSASQINSYNSCPLGYLYKNKLKIEAPKQSDEGFDAAEQGSLMHLCYELFGKTIKEEMIQSIDKEELYELMYQISLKAYNDEETQKNIDNENIHHQIFLSSLQAGLKDEREKGLLAKFVDYYIKNADEHLYFTKSEFEKEFALDSELKPYKLEDENDRNYFIKGFIDRFDNLKDVVHIIDYKSKKVDKVDKEKQTQIDELQDVQLALYILYASQAYPNKIYDSYLLSFKGNDEGVPFASLSNDGDSAYDDEYEQKLKQLIFDTKANIEAGKFSFNNSDEKVCGYCDMRFLCHSGVLSKNIGGEG